MRIAITGGRDYGPSRADIETFWRLWRELAGEEDVELHHGDARGVDRYMAAVVRRERPGVRIVPHPANWDLYGKGAGFIRNQEMVGQVDFLIAFPGGNGTAHCVRTARSLGLTVKEIALEFPDPDATPPWETSP